MNQTIRFGTNLLNLRFVQIFHKANKLKISKIPTELNVEIWNAKTKQILTKTKITISTARIMNNLEITQHLEGMPPNSLLYVVVIPPNTQTQQKPQVISKQEYKEIELLNKGLLGSMYIVKKGTQLLAMKKVPYQTGKQLNAAMKELWCYKDLQHPNLVRYEDIFMKRVKGEGFVLCLVMKYFPVGNIAQYLKGRRRMGIKPEEKDLLVLMVQIADALYFLHQNNCVHRAIHPENILFASNETVKLSDFGIVRECYKGVYIAPEVSNTKQFTFESDMWSLGCLFCDICELGVRRDYINEALAGHTKFVKDIYKRLRKRYSSKLSELVCKLLSRDPKERPNAAEVLRKIKSIHPFAGAYTYGSLKPMPNRISKNTYSRCNGSKICSQPIPVNNISTCTNCNITSEQNVLPFKVIFSDGGEFGKEYGCENMLKNNKMAYCATKPQCINVILELDKPRNEFFVVQEFMIRKPGHGYTSPVQGGVVFVARGSV